MGNLNFDILKLIHPPMKRLFSLHSNLRKSIQSCIKELHCERLEPFIDILLTSLTSSHVNLVTTSVRCLSWLVKFPLRSLDDAKVMEITNKVFELLNKFGGGTDGKVTILFPVSHSTSGSARGRTTTSSSSPPSSSRSSSATWN